MKLTVYLSGEIHTDWREEVADACKKQQLDITFLGPVTDHGASDDCGVAIMGMNRINSGMIIKGPNLMPFAPEPRSPALMLLWYVLEKNTSNGMLLLMPVMRRPLARHW